MEERVFTTTILLADLDDIAVSNATPQATLQVLNFCIEAKSTSEIMNMLKLSYKKHFKTSILKPLIENGLLELTILDKLKSPNQKYKTTQSIKKTND